MMAIVFFSLIFFACKEDEGPTGIVTPDPTTVEGTIYDKLALPIAGAEISLRASFAPAETTLSDSRGNYKFVVQWPDTGTRGWIVLTSTKTGYYTKTDSFSVEAAKTYSKSYSLTSKADTIPPGPNSSGIARLVFISASHSFANVKGVGKRESIVLTFEARDSADVPLDSAHQANIAFRILPAIGGGEKLAPESTKTSVTLGSYGRVITTLTSGQKAGIVQVEASVVGNSSVLATSPAFPIYSGPPDAEHFTIALEKLNFPGLDFLGVQNKVTVQVGDKWGNPVPDSTAIYFTTSGGIIQPAALTDEVGIAQVTLSSGNAQPADGFAWVYASTVGDAGTLVKDSIRVLFSGAPIIQPTDFEISITDGGFIEIPFRVFDRNRNPLSSGERITVTFSGDATEELVVSGSLDVTMPDTQDSLFTFFKVTANDTVLRSISSDKSVVMAINVSGPNGNTLRSYAGLLQGTGGTIPVSGKPASVILTGLTSNTISVHGTGRNETAILTFLVRDQSGRALAQDSATVEFEFIGPNGGAIVFPTSAKTDAQGRVQTAITSGSIAGVVQLVASVDTGGGIPVSSTPVPITIAGGLPDQNHFTIAVEKLNIPGLVTAGVTDGVTVYVGDKYGNPVQPNTAVYFTTTGGYIEASAFTNTAGIASTTLRSGNPDPPNGFTTVTATTVDSSGNEVQNSASVVFSGFPILTTNTSSFEIADDSFYTVRFGLHDINGNPMSGGTTVQFSVGGRNAAEVELFGDNNTTIPDALYGGYRIDTFSITISDKVSGSLKNGEITCRIDVNGPNGSTSRLLTGTLLKSRKPPIKSISLMTDVPRELFIYGLGQLDSVLLTYQLRDSLGQFINRSGEFVTFEVVDGSGNFNPAIAYTDENGQVQTTYRTGIYIDTVTFKAVVNEIPSAQKIVFVRPGPPSRTNARLIVGSLVDTSAKVNFAQQYSNSKQIAHLLIKVMDKYGNAVKEATPIEFIVNAGTIIGSSFTNAEGYAFGQWFGGSIVPNDEVAIIKAMWTSGIQSVLLDSVSVTYSGIPVISGGLTPDIILPSGIDRDYSFRISDAQGNPLAESTKITVTKLGSAANTVILSGDTALYMIDTRDTAQTRFSFHITDTNKTIVTDRGLGIKINVSGPNGKKELVVFDTLKGAIPPPSNAKFVALVDITLTRLSVSGTGGIDRTSLTYELQDSAGAPVRAKDVTVLFDYNGQQGGFDPPSAVTDQNGRVTTEFSTGTIAETVKVFASMGRVVSSKQDIFVLAGPPSRAYFNLSVTKTNDTLPKVNFPGRFNSSKKIGEVRLSLGDRYGNPVANNTKVAFSSSGGYVQDTAFSKNGSIKIDWFGGQPYPTIGTAHIVASTKGQGGVAIGDSLDIVYSGQATVSGGFVDGTTFRQGIDSTIDFTVADALGSPLAEGATVTVTSSGAALGTLQISGDLNSTFTDVDNVEATQFRLNIRDVNTSITEDRAFQIEIRVAGPNGTVTKRMNAILKGVVLPPPPRVAGIRLESISSSVLTVKAGGGTETSLFTYQILDSIGNPILREGIRLALTGTGVSYQFSPETTTTNSLGQAQALFQSDTVAGIVQVIAKSVTGFAQSTPYKVVIVGGKPSQQYFTFLLTRPSATQEKVNYPGAMPLIQKIGEAHVQAGDRYGNPVPEGTPIYFTTNAGVVQGFAMTDTNGFAKVNWFGGNPIPTGGVAMVKASASGEGTTIVSDSAIVTYSGQVMIGGGPQPGFEILGAGSMTFSFTVRDANGNPPAEGSRVLVSASGTGASAVVLSGDVDVAMPDTRDSSLSRYFITVRDTSTFSTKERTLNLSIAVSGPNGTATQLTSGTLLATGGGRTRLPGSIALLSTSENEIQVTGTGGVETSTMIFEIRDSLGVPVDSSYLVRFTVMPALGGAYISPDSGYSDEQTGRITSVIHSGTVSGPIQVVASLTTSSGTVTSSPVRILIHSGQPDQAHMSIGANPINVAGLDWNQRTSTITVQVGDKYGNPVPEGTAVHFSSDIGIVTTSPGLTDADGLVSATLYSANPRSADGFGYIKATTIGEGGAIVTDSVRMLFSGQAMIDSVKLTPSNITNFTAFFRVYDRNHNPLAKDNTITITTDGDVSLIVSRIFPASKLPDTQDPAWTEYAVNFSLDVNDNPITTGPFVATITVDGQNGTAVHSFQGRVDISAPPESEVKGLSLAFRSDSVITVYDAGGLDYALVGYQIIDSLGRVIQRAGIPVAFSSEGVPGSFVPETTLTNDNGVAVSTFHSSTVAGNVSIRGAVVGTTIQSIPMSLGITGGKASQQFFTVRLTEWSIAPKARGYNPPLKYNFAGLQSSGYIGNARVIVGDKYGNPVPVGTVVYFTTNAGVVTGADTTNEVGLAVAEWIGGNPAPPGGIAVVKASVLGEVGLVDDSSWAVYSGPPIISGLLPENFQLRNGIDTVLQYIIEDVNGNPVVSGGDIVVSHSGGAASSIVLDGNVSFKLPDTRDTAFGTMYQVRIRDTNTTVSQSRSLTLSISHTSILVGNELYNVSGTLLGTSSPIPPSLAGIRFVSSTATTLSVKNSGGTETTVLTFEAIDSVGNTIARSGIPISFMQTGVAGTFSADTVLTDNFGRVQTQFRSDTIAGVVQIKATSIDGIVQSDPVSIAIVGGKPNQNNFTFILTRPGQLSRKVNYPGAMPLVQKIGEAIVQVGDKYGNPVPSGTPVYFGTNAGIIQGTAFTDGNGYATVDWFGGNPVPSGGVANVSVTTLGDNGEFTITDTLTYSGQALISGGPANGFEINSGFVQTFTYTVNDANSNPIAQGATIQVSASGDARSTLVLSGDLNLTMPDTRSLTETQFSFTVRDTSTTSRTPRSLQFTISVDGPNGTANLTSSGTVLPAGAGDTTRSRLPGSIAFMSISNTEIQVTGTGGTETTTLLFEVRDSLGIPVDSSYGVKFTFTNSPGGGEFITPDIGHTDAATGQVSAIIHSGTRSGVLQLLASVYTPTDTISSEIVRLIIHAGLPDQAHFSVSLNPINIPGLVYDLRTSTVTALVGDKFGNPVPQGTAVYFTTTLGVVSTDGGFTDENGTVSVTLMSGNPRGDSGFGYVKAFTVGESGVTVTDSARMLFSGYPNITYTGSSTFSVTRGGSVSFTFDVADLYGHPITKGSTIQILATDTESDFGLTGVLTMGDTQVSGPGSTQFTMTFTDIVEDPPIDGPVSISVQVKWEGQTIVLPIATGTITP